MFTKKITNTIRYCNILQIYVPNSVYKKVKWSRQEKQMVLGFDPQKAITKNVSIFFYSKEGEIAVHNV